MNEEDSIRKALLQALATLDAVRDIMEDQVGYREDVDQVFEYVENTIAVIEPLLFDPDNPILNMSQQQMDAEVDEFEKAQELADKGM